MVTRSLKQAGHESICHSIARHTFQRQPHHRLAHRYVQRIYTTMAPERLSEPCSHHPKEGIGAFPDRKYSDLSQMHKGIGTVWIH